MIMRKVFILLVALAILYPPTFLKAETVSPGVSATPGKPLNVNVVLDVTPIRAKPLKAWKSVDALEKLPEEMGPASMVVIFRINRVVRGELKKVKMPSLSLWDQAKDAADDKNILKLATMDFKKPEEDQEKEWFSMIVVDPYASFGIKENEESPKQRYKISLARVQKNPESFILVKSEKI